MSGCARPPSSQVYKFLLVRDDEFVLAMGLILVTKNLQVFECVPELRLDNRAHSKCAYFSWQVRQSSELAIVLRRRYGKFVLLWTSWQVEHSTQIGPFGSGL